MGLEVLHLVMSPQSPIPTSTSGQQQQPQTGAISSCGGGAITQEDLELLVLVQESIRVAVGVFDHLIQYDALDHNDDEMALHYQPINAASMMSAVIAPMKLEAQRKEVFLSGNLMNLRLLDTEVSAGILL